MAKTARPIPLTFQPTRPSRKTNTGQATVDDQEVPGGNEDAGHDEVVERAGYEGEVVPGPHHDVSIGSRSTPHTSGKSTSP